MISGKATYTVILLVWGYLSDVRSIHAVHNHSPFFTIRQRTGYYRYPGCIAPSADTSR